MNCEKTVLHDDILISSPVILAKCLPNPWVKSIQMKGNAHCEVEIITTFYQSACIMIPLLFIWVADEVHEALVSKMLHYDFI